MDKRWPNCVLLFIYYAYGLYLSLLILFICLNLLLNVDIPQDILTLDSYIILYGYNGLYYAFMYNIDKSTKQSNT